MASSSEISDSTFGSSSKSVETEEEVEEGVAFYRKAEKYWDSVDASVSGMLGGMPKLSKPDIHDSRKFLSCLRSQFGVGCSRALDCGAGIGRVTKYLLLPAFETVDMAEVSAAFLEKSESIQCFFGEILNKRVGKRFCCGLQDLQFPSDYKYDLIWCQWVLSHLHDDDLINFFIRGKAALNENGCIAIKENVTSSGNCEFDEVDHSVTRSISSLYNIIKLAGLTIKLDLKQRKFPKELYEVRMLACT